MAAAGAAAAAGEVVGAKVAAGAKVVATGSLLNNAFVFIGPLKALRS